MKRGNSVTDEDIAALHIKSLPKEKLETALNFINDLKEWRSEEKNYSTYFKGTKKALANTGNGKIYFDYRIPGTVTGRLSCGAYKAIKERKPLPLGVSFHTLPRKTENRASIRDFCIADYSNKYYFITGDFKAAELRVLAHVSNDTTMINAFKSKQDPHRYTAQFVYEKPLDEVTKDERQIVKSGNFLIVYGGGPWKLSKTCNISLQVAEDVINRIRQVYPNVFIWMDETKAFIEENKYAVSMFNRRRNLPDVRSKVKKIKDRCFRQGVNFVIQSSASDIVCFSVLDISNEIKFRNMESIIAGSVHDSIEIICPEHELEEMLQIMYKKMTNYPLLKSFGYNLKVDMEIEVEVGKSFGGGVEVKYSDKGTVLNIEDLKNSISCT